MFFSGRLVSRASSLHGFKNIQKQQTLLGEALSLQGWLSVLNLKRLIKLKLQFQLHFFGAAMNIAFQERT